MKRVLIIVLVVVIGAVGLVIVSSGSGADDPRLEGVVTKIDTNRDGSVDVYRAQTDGSVIVEHRAPGEATWFESNEVLGPDGKPIICPDGQELRADLTQTLQEPSPGEIADAQKGLPPGKIAAFNDYTGKFQVLDAIYFRDGKTEVQAIEPLVYECGPDDKPVLAPLSEVDPAAAQEARQAFLDQVQGTGDVTAIGQDPAHSGGNGASAP